MFRFRVTCSRLACMCGRFLITSPGNLLQVLLQLDDTPSIEPRYNAAPSQRLPVVRSIDGARRCDALQWGLVPSWADDPSIGFRMINARSETAASKLSFRSSMKTRRCVVPADGFYEWEKVGSRKQPWVFRMADEAPFAMAGLWASCTIDDTVLHTFTILTTQANATVEPVHHRMPVILDPVHVEAWLDRSIDGGPLFEAQQLGTPFPAECMQATAVSTYVNRAGNEGPACLEPAQGGDDGGLFG